MTLTAFYVTVALCVMASAAPPSPQRFYPQSQQPQPYRLQYYLDNPDVDNYYNQAQHRQGKLNFAFNAIPARLETLGPDSEVELIPGAQQPQQPPQQTPVSPNLPGLLPGQRVFIVNTPVPGYRPGTLGGYQPVYVVGAAPQGNTYANGVQNYPGFQNIPGIQTVQGVQNIPGYQNAVLVDPSGQVVSPLGYRGLSGVNPANPGLFGGAVPYNNPYDLVYQDPAAYQAPIDDYQNRLSQYGYYPGQPPVASRPDSESNRGSERQSQESDNAEIKETKEEPRRNTKSSKSKA